MWQGLNFKREKLNTGPDYRRLNNKGKRSWGVGDITDKVRPRLNTPVRAQFGNSSYDG
jgi:hypothetical protein